MGRSVEARLVFRYEISYLFYIAINLQFTRKILQTGQQFASGSLSPPILLPAITSKVSESTAFSS